MVVEALAGKPEPTGQSGGGVGLDQGREQRAAGAAEGGGGGLGPLDDLVLRLGGMPWDD